MFHLVMILRRTAFTQFDNLEYMEPYHTEAECIDRARILQARGYADPLRIDGDGPAHNRPVHMDKAAIIAAMGKGA